MSKPNDQWMPGQNATYVEQRLERLERMVAHLFRALNEAQESNKKKLAQLNRDIHNRHTPLPPPPPSQAANSGVSTARRFCHECGEPLPPMTIHIHRVDYSEWNQRHHPNRQETA